MYSRAYTQQLTYISIYQDLISNIGYTVDPEGDEFNI